jgi:hypothetical protein
MLPPSPYELHFTKSTSGVRHVTIQHHAHGIYINKSRYADVSCLIDFLEQHPSAKSACFCETNPKLHTHALDFTSLQHASPHRNDPSPGPRSLDQEHLMKETAIAVDGDQKFPCLDGRSQLAKTPHRAVRFRRCYRRRDLVDRPTRRFRRIRRKRKILIPGEVRQSWRHIL